MRIIAAFILAALVFSPATLFAGKVELTTYYPAPYGEYTQLQATGADADNTQVALLARGNAGTGLVVTNANRVGIGIAAPVVPLDVAGAITATGNVTAAAFFYTSDMRLKENIVPVAGSLEKIGRLTGVNFTFKKHPGEKHLGLLAQDVESVVPEIVRTQADGLKAVDYAALTALLIEGMKEQQREIGALREKLDRMEATVGSGN